MFEQHCDIVAAVCSFLGRDLQDHGAIIGLHGGRNCLSDDTVSHPTRLKSPALLHQKFAFFFLTDGFGLLQVGVFFFCADFLGSQKITVKADL